MFPKRLVAAFPYLARGRPDVFWSVLLGRHRSRAAEPKRPVRSTEQPVRVVRPDGPFAQRPRGALQPEREPLLSDDLYVRMSLRVAKVALNSISPPTRSHAAS